MPHLRWVVGLAVVWVMGAACGDAEEKPCANGTCVCEANANCEIGCAAPPCHVDCLEGSNCEAECANGDCICRTGAACSFACDAPPCHVTCDGDNPSCDGACANGQCTCGPRSSCAFVCDAPPCHANCEAGASCSLSCPSGINGNCSLDTCDGEVTMCEDGTTVTCGVPCPS
ncbi:MAG: hypothetical protein ACRBN8_30265 [Nannocystales bacterium]